MCPGPLPEFSRSQVQRCFCWRDELVGALVDVKSECFFFIEGSFCLNTFCLRSLLLTLPPSGVIRASPFCLLTVTWSNAWHINISARKKSSISLLTTRVLHPELAGIISGSVPYGADLSPENSAELMTDIGHFTESIFLLRLDLGSPLRPLVFLTNFMCHNTLNTCVR